MYSGITSGRVLNGELLYTKILEVNLFLFVNLFLMNTVYTSGRVLNGGVLNGELLYTKILEVIHKDSRS